ncbi:MAG: HlyC/CorC family transporter [Myxococcales bacterium]|nr:MAG: HlyC/CorC family transporter [Myxococcales bacterium]
MRADHPGQLLAVVGLILLAGLLSCAEAAISSFSHTRAEELRKEGRAGSAKMLRLLDDQPRYLNTVLFLRMLAETSAVVLGTLMITGSFGRSWSSAAVAIGVMLVILFVFVGVAPRTLGRQHAESVALLMVGVIIPLTRVLGPVPRLLILVGNAITPGRGFSEGPFASEAELRELVDLAEASSLIESDERAMIHSVFELGDTTVREVMVPRTDVVFIERHKTLRQAMSLFLRTGYSRVPVIDEDLDDILGFAYLKDISRRVFDRQDAQNTEQVESLMRPVMHVPDSKAVDDLLREMQAARRHIAVAVDEYGGTAGLVTIEDVLEEIVGEITDEFDDEDVPVQHLGDGTTRVSSRFAVDDLGEAVGVEIEDDEVDSVGGLMAKHLGKVPIPGSVVEVGGLIFTAEEAAGRRKKIGTVRIMPVPALLEPTPAEQEGAHDGS